jgi:hypothetical protein
MNLRLQFILVSYTWSDELDDDAEYFVPSFFIPFYERSYVTHL